VSEGVCHTGVKRGDLVLGGTTQQVEVETVDVSVLIGERNDLRLTVLRQNQAITAADRTGVILVSQRLCYV